MSKKVKAYKGFDKDLKCRGFQYKVGKTYEHDGKVDICESGFHACESPFDVWNYYSVVGSRFAVVTLDGEQDKNENGDSKIAAAKITVEAELTLPEFIKAGIDWLIEKTKGKDDSGDYAQIGSSGDFAKIGSSGYSAKIGSSGYSAKIGSSGYSAKIGSSGYYAQIGSSGDSAKIGSSGYSAQIGSSGYSAQIGSSGDYAQIGSSGYFAKINSEGNKAVIASAGYNAKFKAKDGAWVSVAEYNVDGECVGFVTGKIGENGLLADTWYEANGGEFVEVE